MMNVVMVSGQRTVSQMSLASNQAGGVLTVENLLVLQDYWKAQKELHCIACSGCIFKRNACIGGTGATAKKEKRAT